MGDDPQPLELYRLEDEVLRGIDRLEKLRFDKHSFRDQIFVGLSISLIERCHAIFALLRQQKVNDAQILLRSALEHLIEAKNIVRDTEFHWHSHADFLKGMRLKLQSAKGGNPFFAKIAANIPLSDELERVRMHAEKVSDHGGMNLAVERKFQLAGMHDEYDSIYRSLSKQVHPTYAGIIERHFIIDHQTGDFEVKGFEPADSASWNVVVDTTLQIIEHALSLVEEFEAEQGG